MREYPHGLDEEFLPDDIESARERIDEFEKELKESPDEAGPLMIQYLGKAYYATACYKYALGEAPASIRGTLATAFQHLFSAFETDVLLDVYEFINLISLAVVLGEDKSAKALADTPRDRYTNEGVAADETVFTAAQVMSAFVKRDEDFVARTFSKNNPDTAETKNIYRYDRLLYFPLLRLLNIVHRRDANRLGEAFRTRDGDFVRYWRRADDKNDPDALIDMNGLAITVFARQRALPFSDSSVYRPIELIKETR